MLAYHVEWHLRKAWESPLWHDPEPKAHVGKKVRGYSGEGQRVMRTAT